MTQRTNMWIGRCILRNRQAEGSAKGSHCCNYLCAKRAITASMSAHPACGLLFDQWFESRKALEDTMFIYYYWCGQFWFWLGKWFFWFKCQFGASSLLKLCQSVLRASCFQVLFVWSKARIPRFVEQNNLLDSQIGPNPSFCSLFIWRDNAPMCPAQSTSWRLGEFESYQSTTQSMWESFFSLSVQVQAQWPPHHPPRARHMHTRILFFPITDFLPSFSLWR